MKSITITVIPQDQQDYETIGNWKRDGDKWEVIVSDLKDWRYEVLVAVHELVEMSLCVARDIPDDAVTNFDLQFEADRLEDKVDGEPGDAPLAPYRLEHRFAENIERQLALELGVSWADYEKRIEDVSDAVK